MDLQRLKEFITIADDQSIKAAAAKLGIPVSTLSSRLNSFENALGVSLFHRNATTLTLTQAGKRFYQDAQKINMSYTHLKQDLLSYQQISAYTQIRIGIAGLGMPYHLGPFLDSLNERQPDIKLEILDETQCSIQNGLLNHQVDLYFAPVMNHISYPGIVRLPLSSAHQYVTLPMNHPLAAHNTISLQQLHHETFILYPACQENCMREFQLENLRASGMSYSIYDTLSSKMFHEFLVPIGKGVLIYPTEKAYPPPNCITCTLTGITYSAPVSLFYSKENLRPEIQNFIQEFMRFVKENESHDH